MSGPRRRGPPRQDPETAQGDRPRRRHDGREPRRGRLHRHLHAHARHRRLRLARRAAEPHGDPVRPRLRAPGRGRARGHARPPRPRRRARRHARALDAPHAGRARGRSPSSSAVAREPLAAVLNVDQEWAAAAVPVTGVLWLLLCLQRGLLQSARAYQRGRAERRARGARPARGRRSRFVGARRSASPAPTSARSPRSRVDRHGARRRAAPPPRPRRRPAPASTRCARSRATPRCRSPR